MREQSTHEVMAQAWKAGAADRWLVYTLAVGLLLYVGCVPQSVKPDPLPPDTAARAYLVEMSRAFRSISADVKAGVLTTKPAIYKALEERSKVARDAAVDLLVVEIDAALIREGETEFPAERAIAVFEKLAGELE